MAVHAENLQVSPRALALGTEVAGWRILEPLGEGGFGAAYRVESVAQPGEFCVLKLARERGDERVARELSLLMTRAVHPHVVRLRACGRWPHPATGCLYFVTEWVSGVPLHTWAETRTVPVRSVVEKLATMAATLEHLHAEGVLHRDLKPEHILIREPDGKPMLLGFGVERHPGTDSLTTQAMALGMGTPHLLSPEAVAFWRQHGGRPGARYPHKPTDDVYALGMSAYRVLTGHWAFPLYLAREQLFSVIVGLEPPPPWEVNRKIPQALGEVIQRMMAKRVEDRFPSCAEVHAALVAAVSFSGPEALEVNLFPGEQDPRAPPPWPWRTRRLLPSEPEPPPRKPEPPPRTRTAFDTWIKWLNVVLVGLCLLIAARLVLRLRASQSAPVAAQKEVLGPRMEDSTGLECQLEAIGNMRWRQIGTLQLRPLEHASQQGSLVIDVRDGEKVAWTLLDPWASRVPMGTVFHGRLWVRDRVYGRFERMVLPDGTQQAVCLEFWKSEFVEGPAGQGMSARLVEGVELAQPSPTPGVGRVDIKAIETEPVKRWGALKP
jgi:serine/threonine-protein kinase